MKDDIFQTNNKNEVDINIKDISTNKTNNMQTHPPHPSLFLTTPKITTSSLWTFSAHMMMMSRVGAVLGRERGADKMCHVHDRHTKIDP